MKYSLMLLVAAACSQQSESRPAAAPVETGSIGPVELPSIAIADTATVELPVTLSSQLYVERDAAIYARSAGVVESILVDLGSPVAAGQALARLESTDQSIALAQAQERLANAQQTLERQRALKAAQVTTQAESERAEFEHSEAILAVRKARRDYDLTRIVAPFAGVVTSRTARLHRLVNAGDSLFHLTALKPVLAAVHVPEPSAGRIEVGALAEVVGPDGRVAQARVIRASPVLDPGSGTREMILQLAADVPRLTPGSNVTVRLGSQRRQVVAIPRSAVAQDGYALVWSDDKTILRPITLGSDLDGDRVEVVNGLAPGEKVIRKAP